MKLHFTKIHGLGNDYLFINCMERELEEPEELSKKLSDRHFGVGSDGIILVLPSNKADFKMRMFNSGGPEAEMCGNGIRGFGKYVYDYGLTNKETITVETGAGVLTLELKVENNKVKAAKVDMGEPSYDKINEELNVGGESFNFTSVSMGNPHCVIFVDEITDNHVLNLGPKIEVLPIFPKKANIEFVSIVNENEVNMRVWERGSGETLACGSGASAVCVAGMLNKKTNRKIIVHLLGGDLEIEWANDNNVYMTGPVEKVFDGEIDIEW